MVHYMKSIVYDFSVCFYRMYLLSLLSQFDSTSIVLIS